MLLKLIQFKKCASKLKSNIHIKIWNPAECMKNKTKYSIISYIYNQWKDENLSHNPFLEHPSACSAEETDESISYFQIQDNNGNALDATRDGTHSSSVVMFTQNEFKDSQFWYLSKIPETEYGYIGSKKYISEDKVLTITKSKLSFTIHKVCTIENNTNRHSICCLIKSSKNYFIFLPAFYLIMWLMTS